MDEQEYTLQQALGMLKLNTKLWFAHHETCQTCVWLFDVLCEDAQHIEWTHMKWKERAREAARREGVQITV